MEKKYYLRGLGLGMIVTAVIMGIALSGGTKTREMTDDEVIARAKELGMTEDTRLLEPTGEEKEESALPQTPVRKDIAVKSEAEAAAQKKDEAKNDASSDTDTEDKTAQKPSVDTPEPVQSATSAASTETKPKADTNEMTKQDDDRNPALPEPEEESDTNPATAETVGSGGANPSSGGMKSVTIVSGDSSYTIAKKLEAAGAVSSASSYDTYLCENGYDKRLRTGTFQIPAGATDEQIAKIVTGQQ